MPAVLTRPPVTAAHLRDLIGRVPRVRLAHTPTPLEEMPRLSARLGGPRILVKRDDMTGLAFGGNKVRNLEFRLAEVLAAGADTVVFCVDILSNSARQTAAAANRLGLDAVLVLRGRPPERETGNLLVDRLLGAEILFADDADGQRRAADAAVARLRAAGRRPFVLNDSPLFGVGAALAYADATLELLDQLVAHPGPAVDLAHLRLYITSSGKGQPGLELAVRALGLPVRVTGVRVVETDACAHVARGVDEAAAFLGLDLRVRPDQIDNRADQVGPGYGLASEAGLEAMRLAARTDGLLLDPVYTGKAFAALVADARRGHLTPADVAVFVHTGGLPLMFNLADELAPALR
jgi:1-aminocyclopropane-1-carboxylate deaminase/D-cysteine desulfhydrase-like pyridoxal-dependent ACC family enzyme